MAQSVPTHAFRERWGRSILRVTGLLALLALLAGCGVDPGPIVGGPRAADVFGEGDTLKLVKAACAGDAASVKTIVGQGADPNHQGRDGSTPLLWAVICRKPAGVEALLSAGADPNLSTATLGLSLIHI